MILDCVKSKIHSEIIASELTLASSYVNDIALNAMNYENS